MPPSTIHPSVTVGFSAENVIFNTVVTPLSSPAPNPEPLSSMAKLLC